MNTAHNLKRDAAHAALPYVESGMRLGIGTGSTAEEFVRLLAERVAGGLSVIGVSTSERTEALCRALGVPTSTLDATPELDLTIDGADEIGPGLALIKGGGGALLREKIVAAASTRMIVIADETKIVEQLGAFPLPVEVNRFGLNATRRAIDRVAGRLGLSGAIVLRGGESQPFVTDGGHLILDASFGRIPDPERTHVELCAVPGVVETGLFIGLCSLAMVASPAGIKVMSR
jgi:ribose 5-phosphate isomerase A